MGDSRTLKVEILGDSKSAQAALRQLGDAGDHAQSRLGATGERVQEFGRKTSAVGAKMSLGITAPLALFGKTAFDAASDLNEALSKSNTIFGANAASIEQWAATGARSFGQSKQQALDAAGGFGNMFTQLGIGQDKAAGMSTKMVELASDFASFHNADISEVLTAQSAAFRGEYDAVQRFVPTINAAAVEQKALAMGLKGSTKELTAQDKALATQALLLEGAGAAMGDFARTSDGAANKQRIVKAEFQNTAATLGNVLMPIGQKILGVLSKVAEKFNGLSPPMQKALLVGAGLLAVAGPLVTAIGGLATVVGFLLSPVGLIVAGIAALAVGLVIAYRESETFRQFVDDLGKTAVSVFGDIREWVGQAITDVSQFLRDNRATFEEWGAKLEEIVGRIVEILSIQFEVAKVIIGTAIAIITDLWDRFGSHLWGHIKTHIGAVIDVISGAFRIIQGIWDIFAGIFTGDWSRVWGGIKDVFGGVWDVIKGVVTISINAISSVIGAGMAIISGAWSAVWGGISGFLSGIWEGIKSIVATGIRSIVDFFLGGVEWILKGASEMFGWVPGVGGALKDAASKFEEFRDDVNTALGGIQDKNVKVHATFVSEHFGVGRWAQGLATGGMVPGAGNGDTVPAWLTPGEFVVRKDAVRSIGVPALEQLNVGGFASGGLVGVSAGGRGFMGGSNVTVIQPVVVLELDGKELARVTTPHTLAELQKMSDRGQRLFPPV